MIRAKKIPFGYRMVNGRIGIHPEESRAVAEIFTEYISGKSAMQIALNMKVPHAGIKKWRYEIVQQILRNHIYVGTEQYPALISEETFRTAERLNIERNYKILDISDDLKELRKMTFCQTCGQKLFPGNRETSFDCWGCNRKKCRKINQKMTAHELTSAILKILNAVITNPDLLDVPEKPCVIYSPSQKVTRQQNEIRHMMDNPQPDYDRIRAELFRLAEMKYKCCTYNDITQKTAFLKELFADCEQLHTLDIGLLKSCVKRITVSHSAVIEIEFINGIKLHQSIERNETYGCST